MPTYGISAESLRESAGCLTDEESGVLAYHLRAMKPESRVLLNHPSTSAHPLSRY
jgi:hypothetical protein